MVQGARRQAATQVRPAGLQGGLALCTLEAQQGAGHMAAVRKPLQDRVGTRTAVARVAGQTQGASLALAGL